MSCLGDWKQLLYRRLVEYKEQHGLRECLKYAKAMLDIKPGRDAGKEKGLMVGELAEDMFLILMSEYFSAYKKRAKIFHSVVLKDLRDSKSNFRTELDFIVVSPSFMLTTECKSYSGEVTVSDKCTLSHRGKSLDVYKQSALHHRHLVQYAQQLTEPAAHIARVPVFANVFLFSNSVVEDARTPTEKTAISVLTTSSLFDYYDKIFEKYRFRVFDYERACKIFGICEGSSALHQQHAKFVGY